MLTRALLIVLVAGCRQAPAPQCTLSVSSLPEATRIAARWTCPGHRAASWHFAGSNGITVVVNERVRGGCPGTASFVTAAQFPLTLSQLEVDDGPTIQCDGP